MGLPGVGGPGGDRAHRVGPEMRPPGAAARPPEHHAVLQQGGGRGLQRRAGGLGLRHQRHLPNLAPRQAPVRPDHLRVRPHRARGRLLGPPRPARETHAGRHALAVRLLQGGLRIGQRPEVHEHPLGRRLEPGCASTPSELRCCGTNR